MEYKVGDIVKIRNTKIKIIHRDKNEFNQYVYTGETLEKNIELGIKKGWIFAFIEEHIDKEL